MVGYSVFLVSVEQVFSFSTVILDLCQIRSRSKLERQRNPCSFSLSDNQRLKFLKSPASEPSISASSSALSWPDQSRKFGPHNFSDILPSYKTLSDGTQSLIFELDPQQVDLAISNLNQTDLDWQELGYDNEQHLIAKCSPKYVFATFKLTLRPSMDDLIGLFFLSSNFPDKSEHLFQGIIITKHSFRRKGAGTFMGEVMLRIAKQLNFSIQYQQFVYVNNPASVALCRKLGMKLLSVLPRAGLVSGSRRPRYTDAMQFFLSLNENSGKFLNRNSSVDESTIDAEDEYWMMQALDLGRKAQEEAKTF